MQSALPASEQLSYHPMPLQNSLLGRIILTIAVTEFIAICAPIFSCPQRWRPSQN
jgi:hypothetical protein